jgi:rhodanese-related sulfurtransferase
MLEEAKEVCPTSTRRLIATGAMLVDVRESEEIASCAFDVPALVNIPMSQLEERWREIPKDRDIVMVCLSGERSLKATYFLQYQGYTNVSNMGGGIAKWFRKGFPVKGQLSASRDSQESSCCCAKPGSATVKSRCC